MRRRNLIVLGFSLLVIPVAFWALLAVSLSGGDIKALFPHPVPNPDNPNIIQRKQEAAIGIDALSESIKSNNPTWNFFSSGSLDTCYKGQHNYEVQDSFYNQCLIRKTFFFGFDGDFKNQMLAFEQYLLAQGWVNNSDPLNKVIHEYYDQFYGKLYPSAVGSQIQQTRQYLVSDLPTIFNYQKEAYKLNLAYAERKTNGSDTENIIKSAQHTSTATLFTTHVESQAVDGETLAKEVFSQHEYLLAVSIERIYFEN